MKLFTSDYAVYKKGCGVGGVGGNKPSLRRIGKCVICTSLQQGCHCRHRAGVNGDLLASFGPWGGESRGGSSLEGLD